MKKILLGLFMCAAIATLGQQQIELQKIYGSNDYDYSRGITQTSDGGYLIAAQVGANALGYDKTESGYGNEDYWIIRLDANGNKLWDKTFGGSGTDVVMAIAENEDGSIIVGGYSNSPVSGTKTQTTKNNTGSYDYWVVKTDANGNQIWDRAIGALGHEFLRDVLITQDGNILLAGYSSSSADNDKSENSKGSDDYWIVIVNQNGNVLWDKTIGSTSQEYLMDAIQLSDGGFALAGYSYGSASADKSENNRGAADFWLVKVDADGNKVWDKTVGGDQDDVAYSVSEGQNGNILIGGYSNSNSTGDKSGFVRGGAQQYCYQSCSRCGWFSTCCSTYCYTYYMSDYWVVLVSPSGNKIWEKTFGGYSYDYLRSIVSVPGGFLLLGQSDSYAAGFEKSQQSYGSADIWIIKINEYGGKVWDKIYGGDSYDFVNEGQQIAKTRDGGAVFVAGTYPSSSGNKTTPNPTTTGDLWIVKLQAEVPADLQEPQFANVPVNFAVNVDPGVCTATVNWEPPTATDNVGVTMLTASHQPGVSLPFGNTTISYTAKDAAGNSKTVSFVVTVTDDQAPVPNLESLPDVMAQCSITVETIPTALDNCSTTVEATTEDPLSFTAQGEYFIHWKYVDGNGNEITQVQRVLIDDTTAPAIELQKDAAAAPTPSEKEILAVAASPSAIQHEAATAAPAPSITNSIPSVIRAQCSYTITAPPVAIDNCAGNIIGTTNAPTTYNAQGTYTVVWTFDDGNGNVRTAEQTIIIDDSTAPVPTTSALPTLTGECVVTLVAPTASDNCSGVITATTTSPLTIQSQGQHTIIWEYNDGNGNSTTQEQIVIIDDVTAPEPQDDLPTVTGQCSVSISDAPEAVDNCGNVITATTSDPTEYTSQGTFEITWLYDDGNGNTSTQKQIVIVEDDTAPVADLPSLPVLNAECAISVTDIPTATDNCSGTVIATTDDPLTFTSQGTYTIYWVYTDANGNTSSQDQTVIVDDVTAPLPDVAALPTLSAECGLTVTAVPTATDNCSGTIIGSTTDARSYNEQGAYQITWSFDDGNGNVTTQIQKVVVKDVTSPQIAGLNNIEVTNDAGVCGARVSFAAPTVTDNCGVSGFVRSDNSGLNSGDVFPVGTTRISYAATDIAGNIFEAGFNVVVTNASPHITAFNTPLAPVSMFNAVTVTATHSDSNVKTAVVNWGDGSTTQALITGSNINASHTYGSTGVYTISITVEDACGLSTSATSSQYVVIYDPYGGFVTGGGWFNSPAGAYAADPSLVGKASFGFVSKYQKGSSVPVGNTDFQFQAGSLKFKSTSYEWLVIAGHKAMYKGVGDVNGAAGYGFLVSGVDGDKKGSGSADKFRIKIWSTASGAVVYDNQLGAADDSEAITSISGSIVIHETKDRTSSNTRTTDTAAEDEDNSLVTELSVYPNPFKETLTVSYPTPVTSDIDVSLMNIHGKTVYEKKHQYNEAGTYVIDLANKELSQEMYILRMRQGERMQMLKVIRK